MSDFLVTPLDPNHVKKAAQAEILRVLAFEIADSAARADVESYGTLTVLNDHLWYELSTLMAEERKFIENALRYMHLRGVELPYRVICHPEYPYVRRFEETP